MLEELLNYCDTSIQYNGIESPQAIKWKKRKDWLKSLKDRVQPQPKQEWSERDELMLGKCIDAASGYYSPEDKQSMKEWLYFLKDRYTWKPSDEQMNALNYVVNLMASSERPTENDLYYNILKSLRQQLKKLMEDKLKDK